MKHQSLRQVFKITEWRGGCVYRTQKVGYAWVTFDHNPPHDGNLQYVSISTETSVKLNHNTIRKVADDTPDVDITTLEQLGVK